MRQDTDYEVSENKEEVMFGWSPNEKSAMPKRSNNEKFSEVNQLLWEWYV